MMKRGIGLVFLAGALLLSGCATKKYVGQQIDPVNTKINEVDKNNQNTQKDLDTTKTKLDSTTEKAESADSRAGDALNRADAASKKADQVRADLRNELSDRIANLDDYKSVSDVTVLFKFNSDKLTDEGKEQLDQLATAQVGGLKRYFIAIQGFTDQVGSAEYNFDLSRRRAQAVQAYLVAQHNIPVYRLQIVGLGKEKLADDQKTRDARAKNRRVEVTIFDADSGGTAARAQNPGSQQ